MTPFQEKEIRGVTLRILRGVIIQTVIWVATACGFYFQLKSDIKNLYTLREEGQKYWELKFEQIQLQNNIFQKQLEEISLRLTDLRNQIDNKK